MIYNDLWVMRTAKASTSYKVYLVGRADGHISDWRGTAMRRVTLAGQPLQGQSRSEALALLKQVKADAARMAEIKRLAPQLSGTAFNDYVVD